MNQTRPLEVGPWCPAPAALLYLQLPHPHPQWLRAMTLQVGKSHSPGRSQMLEKEGGWGGAWRATYSTIELGTFIASLQPPSREAVGVRLDHCTQSNMEVEALGLVGAGVPEYTAHLVGRKEVAALWGSVPCVLSSVRSLLCRGSGPWLEPDCAGTCRCWRRQVRASLAGVGTLQPHS